MPVPSTLCDVVDLGHAAGPPAWPLPSIGRLALDCMAECVVVVDERGAARIVNREAKRLFGAGAFSAAPKTWSNACGIFLDDGETTCPADAFPLLRALHGETVREVDLFVRNRILPGGAWITGDAHPLEDEGGRFRGAVMVFREVTVRKRVETVLQQERSRLQSAYRRQAALLDVRLSTNQAEELGVLLDRVEEIARLQLPCDRSWVTLWDPEVESYIARTSDAPTRAGRTRHAAMRWIVENALPLTVSDTRGDPFSTAGNFGGGACGAYAGIPIIGADRVVGALFVADPEPRDYGEEDLAFLRVLTGRAAAAITMVRLYERLRTANLSLQRRSAELEENEQRFVMLADSAPVLIWMSGTDELCTYFNRGWLEFTGRDLEDELGNGWMEGVHPDDAARCARAYAAAFERREKLEVEYRLRRADGAYRWVYDIGAPRCAPDGSFLGFIGTCLDVTDRRTAEAELARHREHLEHLVRERTAEVESSHKKLQVADRLAAIGTLTAGLGHDMNNVLFPVRCRLDAMSRDNVPTEIEDVLNSVTHAVEYLQELTDGLRLFALDPEDADACAQLTSLTTWWQRVSPLIRKALPKCVTLESNFDERLPQIRIAAHRLTQAVLNLVVNAGEAMPDGGLVMVSAHASADGGKVSISVTDNGPGMSADVKTQAFDPFFTTKKRTLSTGLGLSLVHSVVTSSRGTIDVASAPGEGATFTLSFPEAGHEPEVLETPTMLGTACVTVTDPRRAAWVAELLREQGYSVRRSAPHEDVDAILWVVDPHVDDLTHVAPFLKRDDRCRAIVLGNATTRWPRTPAIIRVAVDDLDMLRNAIEECARGVGELAP